jgi:hypothetical protein
MRILFSPDRGTYAPGKLAEAAVIFEDGEPLAGLKLEGFGVFERKGGERVVTYPARIFAHNGERSARAHLRPAEDTPAARGALERLQHQILAAYDEHRA